MDGDWPAAADGPRCERCGQEHLPLPARGRYGCGSCGWPLSPPEVQRARQIRSSRIAKGLLSAVALAVIGLLIGTSSHHRHRGHRLPSREGLSEGRPSGPAEGAGGGSGVRPPGSYPPGMVGPGQGGVAGPPSGPGRFGAASPMLAELEQSIAEMERAPIEARDTYPWNVALADRYWVYARDVAAASSGAPRPAPGSESRARRRMRMDRFVAGYAESQDYLQRARSGYERALACAVTSEHRGRAHQRLGEVYCTLARFAEGLRHAEQARELLGDDSRTEFLRTRCLLGLRDQDEWAMREGGARKGRGRERTHR